MLLYLLYDIILFKNVETTKTKNEICKNIFRIEFIKVLYGIYMYAMTLCLMVVINSQVFLSKVVQHFFFWFYKKRYIEKNGSASSMWRTHLKRSFF